MQRIAGLLLLMTLHIPLVTTLSAETIPKDLTYRIEDSQIIPGIKRSLDVSLNRAVSEQVLRTLALQLKNSEPRTFARTFIAYWLPGMKIGSGAWATSHFDPNLSIRIFGLTPEAEIAIKKAVLEKSSERLVIGSWLDRTPFSPMRGIIIYREKGKLYMDRKFEDGSAGRSELAKIGSRFKEKDHLDSGDYYLIDERGNLQLRDEEGLISTANKVKP